MLQQERNDLSARQAHLSKVKKALLEKRLRGEQVSTADEAFTIPRRPQQGPGPLSLAQQGLWLVDQLVADSPLYNIPAALRLSGPLNIAALQQSFNALAQRHEVLRTTFVAVDGHPRQVIAPALSVPLSVIDLSNLPEMACWAEAQRLANEEVRRPFDLRQGPLIRVLVLQLGTEEFLLLLSIHHIISDGWSLGILYRELSTLYAAFANGKPSPLPNLPIQYADFALWQQEQLQGQAYAEQLAYWKQQLAGAPTSLDLPTDHLRPAVVSYQGSVHQVTLPLALSEALKALSRQEAVTLHMTLVAAFQTLLYRYSGQDDLVLGTAAAGRTRVELEGLIGLFVNTLVLRTDLSGNPPFRELLGRVREVTLGAQAHQEVSFESLVRELQPTRSLGQNPLFQVMLTLDPALPALPSGWEPAQIVLGTGTAKFDLSLELADRPEGLVCRFEYSTDLFEAATISRLAKHWQTLLEGIVVNPEQSISEIPLLAEAERQQLLVEWNTTQAEYPKDQCVHQLFEAQVQRSPDAVAVIFEEQQLTYHELNVRANQLAHHLRTLGVGPEVLVGIYMERSIEMIVALLGVLKAGGAYVPLDPAYPEDRLAFMLQDAQASVLLTQQQLVERLPRHSAKVICLDTDWEVIAQKRDDNPSSETAAGNLVYVIYTSGSTGRPKGVAIAHQSTVAFIHWARSVFTPEELAGVLASTSICFDLSVFEIFVPLSSGGTILLVENLLHLPHLPAKRQVTLVNTVPSVLTELLRSNSLLASVQTVNLAGEPLRNTLVQQLYRQETIQRVYNLYGPTEDTTYSTYGLAEKGEREPSIGRPISNTQVYILNSHLQPVPVGVPGELYIGGDGLARGYLNRPALTAERFIPHPFSNEPGARLYKTGDLVRYRADGSIEHLGRLDSQIKLRGFRVELGEIEAVLAQHPVVRQVVVLAHEDIPGDKRLVAYVVLHEQQSATVSDLRDHVMKVLPTYMMPSTFVLLEDFPLTPNGKVDRRALPVPEPSRRMLEETFVAPSLIEHYRLLQIWEELLDARPIGIRDNFFDLGGHSLLATRLISRIEQAFRKKISLATLFAGPTIEQLADALQQQKEEALDSWSPLVAVQTGGSKRPFFFLHGDYLYGAFYCFPLAGILGPDQPFYALDPYRFDVLGIPPTLEVMAATYLELLRSVQSEGPYLLGGFCNGGLIAYEMARQLQAQGETVDLLVLMEPTLVGCGRQMRHAVNRFGKLLRLDQDKQLYWFLWLQHMYRYLQHIYRYLRFPRYRKSKTELDGERTDQNGMIILTLKQLHERWLSERAERLGSDEQIEPRHRGNGVGLTLPRLNGLFPEALFPTIEALRHDWEGLYGWVVSEYEPGFYPGKSTFFFTWAAKKHGWDVDWRKIAEAKDKEVEVHIIAGTHVTCKTKYLHDLAQRLRMCLSQAQSTKEEETSHA